MSIETMAMEYGTEAITGAASGVAGVIIGWWANRIRAKRAKAAAKATVKAIIILLVPVVTGCATVENLVLAADEKINGSTPSVPEGWEIYWQDYNAAGEKVYDLEDYYKLPEMRPKGGVIPKTPIFKETGPITITFPSPSASTNDVEPGLVDLLKVIEVDTDAVSNP